MTTDVCCQVVSADAEPEGVLDAGYRPAPERVRELAAGEVPVLVRCGDPGGGTDPSTTVALVSVYAWLGARVFATDHPRAARQALDMVASVRGARPPAVARRGLA